MFSTAKTIAAKPTAAKKKEKETVALAGVRKVALLDALIKSATAMHKTLSAQVKESGFAHFMESKGSNRVSSFVGEDGDATCSVEMRKRSSASALNEDEVKVLEQFGIEPFEQVVTQQLFAINPKYAEDEMLLAKVEKALKNIVPDDFIVQQAGVTKLVVSDEMLDTAYKLKDAEAAIEIMTTMALKPKLNENYDMASLFDDAREIMQPTKKAKSALPSKKAA